MAKKRVAYSVDTKNKAVEMKLQGYTTKQVMQELNIKNETQVETWFRWYKNRETHRFHQQIGKQYSFEKGMSELSEIDQLKEKYFKAISGYDTCGDGGILVKKIE